MSDSLHPQSASVRREQVPDDELAGCFAVLTGLVWVALMPVEVVLAVEVALYVTDWEFDVATLWVAVLPLAAIGLGLVVAAHVARARRLAQSAVRIFVAATHLIVSAFFGVLGFVLWGLQQTYGGHGHPMLPPLLWTIASANAAWGVWRASRFSYPPDSPAGPGQVGIEQ